MGRAHGADTVDGGCAGHGGVQGAGVLHGDDHRADGEVAAGKAVGTGDGLDGAGGRLKGAVDGHIHALADKISGGVGGGEIQRQQQGGIIPDDGHLLPGRDDVARLDLQGRDCAADRAADVLGIHSVVVAALGLLKRELGLLHAAGHIRAVDGVEHVALADRVAHLEVGGQDGTLDHRLDGVGVGGGDGFLDKGLHARRSRLGRGRVKADEIFRIDPVLWFLF